ncbi:MAG: ribbon-helix-helix protein, CopG family [Acidobacteria bacterium]|nr:ribbon-helix-helix protein, CopG family [Acidobacteriota bacterium]
MAKVLITLPDELLKQVDQRARKHHLTRSAASREAFRQWLAQGDYIAPVDRPGFLQIQNRMEKARRRRKSDGSAEEWLRRDRDNR